MEDNHKLKIIERFDSYYSGINNKGTFILAVNTLIISGFLIGVKDLLSFIDEDQLQCFKLLLTITIFISLISMALTFLAIIPFFKTHKDSFWFFNSVANQSKDLFLEKIDSQDSKDEIRDINEQIYFLAKGLKSKHIKVKAALIINLIQLLFIGCIACTILI